VPSISDLAMLKPVRSDFRSDDEFIRLSGLWEDHIAPVIVELKRLADTKPHPSSFQDQESFEEAFGFWMGRQGRVIAFQLSNALRRWEGLRRDDDG
jgi:hypothetical protein